MNNSLSVNEFFLNYRGDLASRIEDLEKMYDNLCEQESQVEELHRIAVEDLYYANVRSDRRDIGVRLLGLATLIKDNLAGFSSFIEGEIEDAAKLLKKNESLVPKQIGPVSEGLDRDVKPKEKPSK